MSYSMHLRQMFLRRNFLIEKNEQMGSDRYRDFEIDSLEWALLELTKIYPADSQQAHNEADSIIAKRKARLGAE